jgi:hypothetical protein
VRYLGRIRINLARALGALNRGSTLSARRYLRSVFVDRLVRREISWIEKWSRWRQRRMPLDNSTPINPFSPAQIAGKGLNMGSMSMEKSELPGTTLNGNQHLASASGGLHMKRYRGNW